jgi:hypothetical protein
LNGNLMYEMARQRMAEQGRAARRSGEARGRIAAALGRRARQTRPEAATLPAIPDYAHELLAAGDSVPAQRPEEARGGSARTGR